MTNFIKLEYMHPDSFDWLSWSAGRIEDLGLECCRTQDIIRNKHIVKKYAIGFCPSNQLICRPKPSGFAVMFLKDENKFWTHLTEEEYIQVFLI